MLFIYGPLILALISAIPTTVFAKRVVENWEVTYVTSNRGLDQPPKRGVGVNHKFPLPVVHATKGDTLVLNIFNSLNETTTMHSHGLFQRNTTYYDGAAMTTECSITPGTSFSYEIPLEQAGTYWIHGHSHSQNFDGLRTPLIIHDPKDPYKSDGEYVVAVEDWWPVTFNTTLAALLDVTGQSNPFAQPPNLLVNGHPDAPRFDFIPGQTYRIRLVSMMSLPLWEFAIDGHELEIIEVDGVNTKPKKVNVVRLAPAQRVSVLVKAKESCDSNYSYHVTMFGNFLPPIPGVFPSRVDGLVAYSSDAPLAETVGEIPSEPFDEMSIESLHGPIMKADRGLYFNATSGFLPDGTNWESFNLVTYRNPDVPSVFTALTDFINLNPISYGPQTNAHVLQLNEVIEMLFWSATQLSHPLHLHGHVFQIVEKGFINDTMGALTTRVAKDKFPLQRDTVLVNSGEYVVVRFKADNPGVWLMHCHFDWHMALGLNMVFVEAPKEMMDVIKVPQSVIDQCKRQGIETKGNVVGNMAYDYDGAPNLPHLLHDAPAVLASAA
ncbi:ferroxidase fet3 [Kickxella alabastrina]|uniref:Ferroxidase fet3 n=1 Tax=Kickxella alabastrina TaxID=61397 RepID=A0ACC1ISQ6_9FUNG|nr:ferroxidase fet3 [Kickxella alabastrina]